MAHTDILEKLERFFKREGIPSKLDKGRTLVAKWDAYSYVIEVDEIENTLRIILLTDNTLDPLGFKKFSSILAKLFHSSEIRFLVDPEGYIALSIDIDLRCADSQGISLVVEKMEKLKIALRNLMKMLETG